MQRISSWMLAGAFIASITVARAADAAGVSLARDRRHGRARSTADFRRRCNRRPSSRSQDGEQRAVDAARPAPAPGWCRDRREWRRGPAQRRVHARREQRADAGADRRLAHRLGNDRRRGVREHSARPGRARIELVAGPLSGLYGADAVGGVIQIFTKGRSGAPGYALVGGLWQCTTRRK